MPEPRPTLPTLFFGTARSRPLNPGAVVLAGLFVLLVLAVLFVVLLPVALVAAGVLLVGLGVAWLKRSLASVLPDPEGRRNVRVVAPSDDQA